MKLRDKLQNDKIFIEAHIFFYLLNKHIFLDREASIYLLITTVKIHIVEKTTTKMCALKHNRRLTIQVGFDFIALVVLCCYNKNQT